MFGCKLFGWFRVTFSIHQEVLEEGLARIGSALALQTRKVKKTKVKGLVNKFNSIEQKQQTSNTNDKSEENRDMRGH